MKPVLHANADTLPQDTHKIDRVKEILTESFFIDNPTLDKRTASVPEIIVDEVETLWYYYPDSKTAVHLPNEATYQKIRTARNRNLITEVEQAAYRHARVAIAGLSVGSMALSALVQTGGPRNLKIADPDIVEISNLNRIKATVLDIGKNKTHVAARESWLIDPFLEIETWDMGVSSDTLERFVTDPKVDVFVDEMDDIRMKILARLICRKHGIPVVMATDNGDSAIVDVERFDIETNRPIFHGRVSLPDPLPEVIDRSMFIRLANEIIDPQMFTKRQWSSIQDIGKSLSGVPQLGTAAMIAGASVAYAVRQITSKSDLPSGRYVLGCDPGFSVPVAQV